MPPGSEDAYPSPHHPNTWLRCRSVATFSPARIAADAAGSSITNAVTILSGAVADTAGVGRLDAPTPLTALKKALVSVESAFPTAWSVGFVLLGLAALGIVLLRVAR